MRRVPHVTDASLSLSFRSIKMWHGHDAPLHALPDLRLTTCPANGAMPPSATRGTRPRHSSMYVERVMLTPDACARVVQRAAQGTPRARACAAPAC